MVPKSISHASFPHTRLPHASFPHTRLQTRFLPTHRLPHRPPFPTQTPAHTHAAHTPPSQHSRLHNASVHTHACTPTPSHTRLHTPLLPTHTPAHTPPSHTHACTPPFPHTHACTPTPFPHNPAHTPPSHTHNTTVNKVVHFDLLNDHLEACFEKTQAQIFQQDGASCHTARDVIQWLDDCKIGRIEDWPGLFHTSGFCRPVSAARFSFLLTLMGVFTLGRDGSFAVAAAAPCRPTSKTATAEMPANGLGGNVLLWVPSHIRCFPRAAGHRVVSCLSTLGGRAQHHLTSSASLEKLAPERMLRERACGRNRKVPATRHGFLPHAAAAETGRQKPLV
ncbi:hypothetical protein GWK47_050589 [Chionoecetes opilio]|uniref:Uncharacterized protein n=1 Tax=Chionoecetes opilio TaxID=41210 RepID=A0A8J4Y1F8_CHIOP|nr:hypothetical protein GWK47_050589 [Chionoecetes opilio]